MSALYGCYRAVVEDPNDPEERGRYRVRVPKVHTDDIPVQNLEWAELGTAVSSKGARDIPHYERGDRVWVMFEGGDRRYPVIIGGWVSYLGGTPDLPPENLGDYNETRKRWRREDAAGNVIEVSELDGERHVLLQSGAARIRVTQAGDTIVLDTSGAVVIDSAGFVVGAKEATLTADTLLLEAVASTLGVPSGVAALLSNALTIIASAPLTGTVLLGQYLDDLQVPKQTQKVRAVPNELVLGEASPTDGFLPTITALLDALRVTIGSANTVETVIKGATVSVGDDGTATLDLSAAVINVVANAGQVSVTAPGGTVEIDAAGGIVNIGQAATQVNVG